MTRSQFVRATIYGLIFWFAAAMFVRFLPQLFDGAASNALLLAVSVPACWLSVSVSRWATGVDRAHVLDANVVAIVAATFADGIGITYLSPLLYAGVTASSQFGAAWILWGVGWILVFAWRERALT